ncbi:hypothetical protein MKX01_022827, partial [Papaver californicum]
ICSRIFCGIESDPRLKMLFVLKDSCSDELPPQLFVDTAVYPRNRYFRLALSSKAGKSSVLSPTGGSNVRAWYGTLFHIAFLIFLGK